MDMTDRKLLHTYHNGNYNVEIYSDGTKIKTTLEDEFISMFPDSIDVKITNYCDLNCPFCHEQSTTKGKHADINKLLEIIDDAQFPKGIELAIGGGNPLEHSELFPLLIELKLRGFVCNITTNQSHILQFEELIRKLLDDELIKGLGISVRNSKSESLKLISELSPNIVFHLIAGVNTLEDIDNLLKIPNCKVLILGYKQYGRGKQYYDSGLERDIVKWKEGIQNYFNKCIVSFDNLAIEQLDIKNKLTPEQWETFYQGDDFTHSMYIDAVEQQYAPTSRSSERVSFEEMNLIKYFNNRNLCQV